jgi:hypothetical protein
MLVAIQELMKSFLKILLLRFGMFFHGLSHMETFSFETLLMDFAVLLIITHFD